MNFAKKKKLDPERTTTTQVKRKAENEGIIQKENSACPLSKVTQVDGLGTPRKKGRFRESMRIFKKAELAATNHHLPTQPAHSDPILQPDKPSNDS